MSEFRGNVPRLGALPLITNISECECASSDLVIPCLTLGIITPLPNNIPMYCDNQDCSFTVSPLDYSFLDMQFITSAMFRSPSTKVVPRITMNYKYLHIFETSMNQLFMWMDNFCKSELPEKITRKSRKIFKDSNHFLTIKLKILLLSYPQGTATGDSETPLKIVVFSSLSQASNNANWIVFSRNDTVTLEFHSGNSTDAVSSGIQEWVIQGQAILSLTRSKVILNSTNPTHPVWLDYMTSQDAITVCTSGEDILEFIITDASDLQQFDLYDSNDFKNFLGRQEI